MSDGVTRKLVSCHRKTYVKLLGDLIDVTGRFV